MSNFGLKSRNLTSWIAITVSGLIVIALTFAIESNLNTFQAETQKEIFKLSLETEENILFINYNNDKRDDLRAYDADEINLPRFIKAESDLTLEIFGDTFLTLSKGADLRVIIFDKNRVHISLVEGEAILDNRLSHKASSIQAKNTLLKPYERGIYRVKVEGDSVELESIEGQSIIGIYEDSKLTAKKLLARSNTLKFNEEISEASFNPLPSTGAPLAKYAEQKLITDIDKKVNELNLFSSKYKGKQITPDSNTTITRGFIKTLTFNNTKKQFLSLYPYQQNILQSAVLLSKGSVTEAKVLISDANLELEKEFAKNPKSVNSFKLQLAKDYQVVAGLSSVNKMNPLKENIENKHRTFINEKFYLELILSNINDAYILFQQDEVIQAEEKINNVSKAIDSKLTSEDMEFLIYAIDNISTQNPEANFEKTYEIRQALFDEIKDKSEDFKDAYRKATNAHIDRLKDYASKRTISTGKIKDSALILIGSLDSIHQLAHEDFIDELNIQGIQLGF